MSADKLGRVFEPGALSCMGGAANGGSAKPAQERERLDEQNQGGDLDSPPRGSEQGDLPAGAPSGQDRPAAPGSQR